MFDEGLAHRVMNLYVDEIEENVNYDMIKRYVSLLPHIDYLIVVKSSVEDAFVRIHERGLPCRLENKTEEAILRFLKNSNQATNIIKKIIKEKDTKVIEIENKSNKYKVKEALNKLIIDKVINDNFY